LFYLKIYKKLCEQGKLQKENYCKGSGLHNHRIIPGHIGGEYNQENSTFLTPREHTIAHFLLWKIYRNPNDLRSMHMLGAKLTYEQRRIVGIWCADNNIGFHKYIGTDFHKEYSLKGIQTQKENYENFGIKQSFYYWSTKEGIKERASLGGTASWEVQKSERNGLPYCISQDPEVRKRNASKAAKASSKFPVTDGIICKKFKTEDERKIFLSENKNFKSGGRPYKRKTAKKEIRTNTRVWINKETTVTWVTPDKIDLLLEQGWKLGRG